MRMISGHISVDFEINERGDYLCPYCGRWFTLTHVIMLGRGEYLHKAMPSIRDFENVRACHERVSYYEP